MLTATFLTALAALATAVLTYIQLRQFRFAHSVDLLFQLEDRFETPIIRGARKSAAMALKNNAGCEEIEPVLDFFETIGILIRRHAVDEELVWNSFSHWALRYAALAREQIELRRISESDATYYEEFDQFVGRLTKIDTRKRRLKSPQSFSKNQLDGFLNDEASD
jgi:hypothetical protein